MIHFLKKFLKIQIKCRSKLADLGDTICWFECILEKVLSSSSIYIESNVFTVISPIRNNSIPCLLHVCFLHVHCVLCIVLVVTTSISSTPHACLSYGHRLSHWWWFLCIHSHCKHLSFMKLSPILYISPLW